MNASWRTETGHLACHWFEIGELVRYSPRWMQESSEISSGSYLPPIPDFASHSPFGGAAWFQPHTVDRDSE